MSRYFSVRMTVGVTVHLLDHVQGAYDEIVIFLAKLTDNYLTQGIFLITKLSQIHVVLRTMWLLCVSMLLLVSRSNHVGETPWTKHMGSSSTKLVGYLRNSIFYIHRLKAKFLTTLLWWFFLDVLCNAFVRILVQVTICRRLRIGRDGHLDQSEAYDIW